MPVTARERRLGLAAAALVTVTPIISHSFGRSTYGLLLPAIEDTLHLDHAQTGLGGTTIFAAYLLGVITVAALSRRCEPITIMRGAVVVAAAGLLWMSTVHGLGALLVGLLLCGGAGAGIWITAPAILTAAVSPDRRGLVIGFLTASTGLGTFLVGMATNAARHHAGDDLLWRPVWVVEAGVCVVFLLGLITFVRPPRTARHAGAGFSLEQLRRVPHWPRVTLVYALFGLVGAGFAPFLVRALQSDAGFGKAAATSAFATMSLLAIPGAPLIGLSSDRFGRKPAMLVVLFVAATATAVVALAPGRATLIGVFAYGAVWASFPPLVATYVRDHTEARAFNEAFSTMTIFYSLAALCSPLATGWLAERTGHFRTPYLALAALCGTGAVLLIGLPTVDAAVDAPAREVPADPAAAPAR